jgi:xylulokinase
MSILSVDVGSSRCKAALIAAGGEVRALRSTAYSPQHPRPGFLEIDAGILFSAVTDLCREMTEQIPGESIEAVCISSHGETLIPVGADGCPLCPAILNADSRAVREAEWCEQEIGRERLYRITGHVSHPMYPVPKLLWLKRNAPEVFACAQRFLGVTDYLLFRLGLDPLIDYSHAARFMALDVARRAWSDEVLSAVGIPPQSLSTLVQAGTIAGKLNRPTAALLGVPAGTPVVVGGHDQVVGAIGLGILDQGRSAGSLGTYECVLVVSDQSQLNSAALESSLNTYPHAVPGKYVRIAYFPSGIMMEWLNRLLFGDDAGDANAHWKQLESCVPRGPTGLLITPHLIGSCNPEFDDEARAGIGGLTPDSSRSHFYKGVLEGIACELALVSKCIESAGSRFEHIHVAGGGTRSPLGLGLRAALTGKTLHLMQCQESVCLGGAMLAYVALGVYSDLTRAADAMVREQLSIPPDTAMQELYRPQFARYCQFRSTLVHSPSSCARSSGGIQ